ncbi:MAG: PAS domain-containing protein [Verrucomicrobia bacterium]|nr:PAS domain-containing protein [Verrucomicrobiota bacterium]
MTGWYVAILLSLGLAGLHLGWLRRYRRLALGQAAAATKAPGMTDVFAHMPEGVLLTSPDGLIEFANPAFCRLFGLADEPRGNTVMEAIRIHQANELVDRLKGESSVVQEEFMLPGLDPRYLQVNGVAIREKQGRHRGAILVFHDLTRLKRLENMRQEIVANVSHELRTPLSIIKGYVETLLDAEPDTGTTAHRFLKKIENHSDRLAYLIEDILTLSTLESGGTGLELREVNLHQLAEGVLDGLREMADKKKVQLKNSVPETVILKADSQRLFQALNNLVENGIKYGGECVRVSASQADGKLDLCVADDGPGIPAEACDRIFERFFRVDKARSRELGGTGLGLSIVKHITQLHGGTARVESQLGEGASFHLTFPSAGVEAT